MEMEIKNAKYNVDLEGNNTSISATINGLNMCVPLGADGNTEYEEIKKQLDAGTLTIKDAD